MHRRRIGRAVVAAIAVSVLVMVAAAAPASALSAKVDVTLTATNGCRYHIEGTVFYGPFTAGGFVGTVTISGDGPECNGIITFDQNRQGSRTTERLTAILDTKDLRLLSRITWQGSNRAATTFLNADSSNSVICDAIRNAVNGG
jgi:hypothetical protein